MKKIVYAVAGLAAAPTMVSSAQAGTLEDVQAWRAELHRFNGNSPGFSNPG